MSFLLAMGQMLAAMVRAAAALARAGFDGPIALKRVDGRDDAAKMPAEVIDERIARARRYLVSVLERV